MVHRRELDGREVVFGNQGALFGNAMTWWDHDTGTVWSQPLGEAIVGPRAGATIELLPSQLTSWVAWRDAHPDTLALDAPAGRAGIVLAEEVIVVEFAGDAAAYPITALRESGLANDIVGGAPIAVVVDPSDPQRWAVFSRTLDDRTVELEIRFDRLVDRETQTVWDPVRGIGLDGPLAGEILDLLPGVPAFERDVPTFWPTARFWPPSRVLGSLGSTDPVAVRAKTATSQSTL